MVGWIKRCLLRGGGGDPQPMAKVAIDLIPKFSLCPALKTINAIGVDTSNIIIPRAMCYERPPSVAVVATGRGVASFICFPPSRSEGGGLFIFLCGCVRPFRCYLFISTHSHNIRTHIFSPLRALPAVVRGRWGWFNGGTANPQ